MVNPFAKKAEPSLFDIETQPNTMVIRNIEPLQDTQESFIQRMKNAIAPLSGSNRLRLYTGKAIGSRKGSVSIKAATRMNRDARNVANRQRVNAMRETIQFGR